MHTSSILAFAALLGSAISLPSPPSPHHTPKHPHWRNLAPIPLFPRQEHSTVFLDGSGEGMIAILGGIIPNNDTLSIPVETTALMQFYEIKHNTWTTKPPLPKPLNHLNAAVVNRKIYVLGGLSESEEGDAARAWRKDASAFVYDSDTDSWASLPDVPSDQVRGSAAVGVHGTKIYLAGGMTELELSGDHTQATVSVVSVFDTATGEWLDVPHAARDLPEGRDHAGAAVIGDKLYVLGGRIGGQENVRDTVFVLDLCNTEAGWTTRAGRMPTARGGLCAGIVGSKIVTFGGEGNGEAESGVFDQVEAYDTRTDTWEKLPAMPIPRHGTYAVGARGRVYIPGGGVLQGGGPVADFDVFEY